MMKRGLVISDLHCGHLLGLTPPRWQTEDVQRDLWKWYVDKVQANGPYDFMICNGDAVDGIGRKETHEHGTTDTNKQVREAIECIDVSGECERYFTLGTPYHVTNNAELEEQLATHFRAPAKPVINLSVNGCLINAKHTTSKTSIPHGQGLVLKQALWELVHAGTNGTEAPDIIIRSHIHEYVYIDSPLGCIITTPALQIGDTSYGRKFSGYYDVGITVIEINGKKEFSVNKHIYRYKKSNEVITI